MELRNASADPLLPTVPDRGRAVALACVIYLVFATLGYLFFTDSTDPVIFNNLACGSGAEPGSGGGEDTRYTRGLRRCCPVLRWAG